MRDGFDGIGRRGLLKGAAVLAGTTAFPAIGSAAVKAMVAAPGDAAIPPNYWCTWSAQNYLFGQGVDQLDPALLEGSSGAGYAQRSLNEDVLLGPDGWARTFFPAVRDRLYLVLDDGWETGGPATFLLDEAKFPSFKGTPPERLRKLNDAVRALGWRGLALWCRDTPSGAEAEKLVDWSKAAGIAYWKIDGGDRDYSTVRARDKARAPLVLEHMNGEDSLNGDWLKDGRFGVQEWDSQRTKILRQTDVYRTYDTTEIMAVPTTLDRIAQMLRPVAGRREVTALLNVEDEVYAAAVLGCTMGVMRHPQRGLRPGADVDLFFPGLRRLKQRIDEVSRALAWQSIAPPMAAGATQLALSDEILTDDWVFRRGQTWFQKIIDQHIHQGAPACIVRNGVLPDVACDGPKPFVAASRFPNGTAAIGTFERVLSGQGGMVMPRARVHWHIGSSSGPIGIFGRYDFLTLLSDKGWDTGPVMARDLAGGQATDISAAAVRRGNSLVIPGEVIDRIGCASGTAGDPSLPGMVLTLG